MPHPESRIRTTRTALAEHLTSYGEEGLAAQIAELPQQVYDSIEIRSFRYALQGTYLAKALSLAAVEIIEGSPRPLKRMRRRFPKP